MSSLRGTNPSSSKQDDRSYPPTPVFTREQSITRQSWELRRARSKSVLASHRRGSGERPPPLPKGFLCNACDCTFLCDNLLQPLRPCWLAHSLTIPTLGCLFLHSLMSHLPNCVGHVSPQVRQHSAQMELLGIPLPREWATGRRRSMHASGDLSMAAHAELLATQIKDEATMGPVDEESLNSTFGDSSNQWRSSNTSSSSQTHAAIQRMTRLDTAAWQIAYNELKFSRQIGEGSFGRVFLGKWRETTVAIKLLNPTVRKTSHGSDSDDGEVGRHQVNSCKPGLLDDLDKEAGIMAALRHPNVVMFLGVCLEPPCMVAEVTILPSASWQRSKMCLTTLSSVCWSLHG